MRKHVKSMASGKRGAISLSGLLAALGALFFWRRRKSGAS
jgi:LPXTG-motif cell wall-anchored protein